MTDEEWIEGVMKLSAEISAAIGPVRTGERQLEQTMVAISKAVGEHVARMLVAIGTPDVAAAQDAAALLASQVARHSVDQLRGLARAPAAIQ